MNLLTKMILVLLPAMTLSMTASAHDPKEHLEEAEKVDCSEIDMSNLTSEDPLAIAIMKKCLRRAEQAEKEIDHAETDNDEINQGETHKDDELKREIA